MENSKILGKISQLTLDKFPKLPNLIWNSFHVSIGFSYTNYVAFRPKYPTLEDIHENITYIGKFVGHFGIYSIHSKKINISIGYFSNICLNYSSTMQIFPSCLRVFLMFPIFFPRNYGAHLSTIG